MIYFVTGSESKFSEARAIIPELEQLEIDLPEIQDLNPKAVIQAKLEEAAKHHEGDFVVEDTSLSLDALNGFPGTLVKWMLEAVKPDGMYQLALQSGNQQATARTVIGYRKAGEEPIFFEGSLNGKIVAPEGRGGFGFDPIFQPDGFHATFGEMDPEEKTQFSMRTEAFKKLKSYLDRQV
jgi:non-canonical purine NTP pyrophosphatase (RdgB/HAM1 family)